ncbi:hypothetical protein [Cereibacter sediminicola]|uniref:hypothetical protein n=1 Tax=Cereibacter sediminicola TaxID=2584941 RepID=UPI0011A8564F|nr:hypothetical protein [Cereibacter sediminicola]
MNRIDRSQLEAMLMDIDVPDEAIRPYLQLDPLESAPYEPTVVANPARVAYAATEAAMALNSLNGVARWRRQQRYARKIGNWNGLKVVAEGDSWFQYPFLLDDVIDHLFDRWAIYCVSAAGDLLRDMARQEEVTVAVLAQKPDLLLLSGGGNDVLGGGALQKYLLPFDPAVDAAGHVGPAFDGILRGTVDIYADLIEGALRAGAKRVVCHSYDHVIPNGGRWLGRPMAAMGIADRAFQRQIIRVLIDRFHEALAGMAARFGGRVTVADCRGRVPDAGWYDELHPTSQGFVGPARVILAAVEGMSETTVFAVPEMPMAERPLPAGEPEAAATLLDAEEEALVAEIGRRQALFEVDPSVGGTLALELPVALPETVQLPFRDLGLAVVTRLERELHTLMCTEAGQGDREALQQALGLPQAGLVGAMTAALMGLGCPAFVAPLVAAVIVKRGVAPAWDETCRIWSLRLEAMPEVAPADG